MRPFWSFLTDQPLAIGDSMYFLTDLPLAIGDCMYENSQAEAESPLWKELWHALPEHSSSEQQQFNDGSEDLGKNNESIFF